VKVKELRWLLRLVDELDDNILNEVSSLPESMLADYLDRVIVVLAKGEREWRADVRA